MKRLSTVKEKNLAWPKDGVRQWSGQRSQAVIGQCISDNILSL